MIGVGLDKIQRGKGFVHAHHGFGGVFRLPFHQRKVGLAIELVHINVLAKIAPRRVHQRVAHFFQQAFGAAAVFNQVGNRADF